MSEAPDISHLLAWIGREEVADDVLTAALAARFHATLDLPGEAAQLGEIAPRLIHFCLCQPAVGTALLGLDGHPQTGGFLPPASQPPLSLTRRMWAASTLRFSGDLRVGDAVTRRSRIADVTAKQGRSGTLRFVTVEHQVSAAGAVVIAERQSLVYRSPDGGGEATVATPPAAATGDTSFALAITPPLLFRYSALTFNAHRIHYDLPYATQEEGYPGLVVHGPLQATLLFQLAAQVRNGRPPDEFSFRSAAPLFAHDPVMLHAGPLEAGRLELWSTRPDGPAAMKAEAKWL